MLMRSSRKAWAGIALAAVLLCAAAIVVSCGGGSDTAPAPSAPFVPPTVTASGMFVSPAHITNAGDGILAVTDAANGAVIFMNTTTLEMEGRFTVPGNPMGIAVAGNKVFVGIPERQEMGRTKGGNVNAFDRKGKYLYTLGSAYHGYGAVKIPVEIVVDEPADSVFVLDGASSSIKIYSLDGTFSNEIFFFDNDSPPSPSEPTSISIDTSLDLLFVADSRITYESSWLGATVGGGIRTVDYSGNPVSTIIMADIAEEFALSRPGGLGMDLRGNFVLTDLIQNRIVVINTTASDVPRAVAPAEVAPETYFAPLDIHIEGNGDIFITESRNGKITVMRGEGI